MKPSHRLPTVAAILLAFGSASVHAAWPEKPIRLVVTFAPGGASDMVGREIVVPRSKALDQTVIVDNKPGAGGTIGGAEMARSAPDGYTLMLANSAPLSIGQIVGETVKMDLELNMTHVP